MNVEKTSDPKEAHTVRKHFFNEAQKKKILTMYASNVSVDEIAKQFSTSKRQISTYINQVKRGQKNTFTEEEDFIIIKLYKIGLTKESAIAKILKTKTPWMIRNRIKYLKKTREINEGIISIPNVKPKNISPEPPLFYSQLSFQEMFNEPDQFFVD